MQPSAIQKMWVILKPEGWGRPFGPRPPRISRSNGKLHPARKNKRRKKTAVDAYREKIAEIEKQAATPARLPAPRVPGAAPKLDHVKRSLEVQALEEAFKREAGFANKDGTGDGVVTR